MLGRFLTSPFYGWIFANSILSVLAIYKVRLPNGYYIDAASTSHTESYSVEWKKSVSKNLPSSVAGGVIGSAVSAGGSAIRSVVAQSTGKLYPAVDTVKYVMIDVNALYLSKAVIDRFSNSKKPNPSNSVRDLEAGNINEGMAANTASSSQYTVHYEDETSSKAGTPPIRTKNAK